MPGAPPPTDPELARTAPLTGIATWRHDLTLGRVFLDARAWAVLERDPVPEGVPLEALRGLIHPQDLPRVVASAETALARERPVDMEARYRRVDGRWRTLMLRRAVQRDADGRPVAFVGIALDVTDRIDTTRREAELGRRFELVTGTAGIGWWTLEGEDDRPGFSAPLRALHGLPDDAEVPVYGDWLRRCVHPDDRMRVHAEHVEWLRSGRPSIRTTLRLVRPDGAVRDVVAHSWLESAPPHRLLFGLVFDVTEQRSAELALRTAAERAALAARGAGIGTWALEFSTLRSHWDEQMWRLRGREPEAQAPDAAARLAMLHPEDRDEAERRMRPSHTSTAPIEHQFRVVWPDGTVRWIAARSVVVTDAASGAPLRRIGVNWDVTDRHAAEQARREGERALHESRAKSRFLARMSHELRTPLNAVLGFTELLLREDDDPAERPEAAARRRARLQHVLEAGRHLLGLVDDALDLSGLQSGELQVDSAPVPLQPLLDETLPQLGSALAAAQLRLTVDLPAGVVPLADAGRLRQVLLNLLHNAVAYNRPGGEVALAARAAAGQVEISVSDTGRGIAPERLPSLFEPFDRSAAGDAGRPGIGMGLAIARELAGRMHGTLRVASRAGEGSVFTLTLPDAATPAQAAQRHGPAARAEEGAPSAPPEAASAAGRLLYIEDNPVNAMIVTELVGRRADLRIEVAPDGLSGVQRAAELRPDLLLLDMQLPDIDGHEVLRRLRADPATAAIPVIALSANAMPADIARAMAAGLADYWTKPLDFAVFNRAIAQRFGPSPGDADG